MPKQLKVSLVRSSAFALLALAGTAVSASAATLSVPTLNNPVTSIVAPAYTLQETFNFTVSGNGFAEVKSFGNFSSLSNVTEKIYKTSTSSAPISVYAGAAGPISGSYTHYLGNLYDGSYYAVVSGLMTSMPASLTVNVSAVPLPSAALLFGSAVVGLTAFRLRRKNLALAA